MRKMLTEHAEYYEILASEFPDVRWHGSGRTYDSIVWEGAPISKQELDALVVKVARKREIRRATKRIRQAADDYIEECGFYSAAVGRLLHYTGDHEAFDYLTAQAMASTTDPAMLWFCVTEEGLTPHTAEQVRYAHKDAVETRQNIYLSMMQQIRALDTMPYADIVAATYVPQQ